MSRRSHGKVGFINLASICIWAEPPHPDYFSPGSTISSPPHWGPRLQYMNDPLGDFKILNNEIVPQSFCWQSDG